MLNTIKIIDCSQNVTHIMHFLVTFLSLLNLMLTHMTVTYNWLQ